MKPVFVKYVLAMTVFLKKSLPGQQKMEKKNPLSDNLQILCHSKMIHLFFYHEKKRHGFVLKF